MNESDRTNVDVEQKHEASETVIKWLQEEHMPMRSTYIYIAA